jgi:ferredoxin
MSQYQIHVQPDNRTIQSKEGQSILDTASRNGVKIKVGCKGGGCGICKIKILEGEVERGITSRSVLSLEEIEQGYALSCKTEPKSDIVITYEKK